MKVNFRFLKWTAIVCFIFFLGSLPAFAKGANSYTITIKEHKFDPAKLIVPAGEKIKLIIDNQDPTSEEFESYELNREKIVFGHKQIVIFVGPLKPGLYKYFGEFHQDTAQGEIIAQ